MSHAALTRGCVNFDLAQLVCGFIEHAIDVLVAVGRAELLGQGDRFIDHDFIGHIEALCKLPGTHAQQRSLNRVQLVQLPVQQRGQACEKETYWLRLTVCE